jgi:hypothetical protein
MSGDGVTALVGQNESGKSAILDALSTGFGTTAVLSADDIRRGEGHPHMALKLELSADDVASLVAELPSEAANGAMKLLNANRKELVFLSFFYAMPSKSNRAFSIGEPLNEALVKAFTEVMPEPAVGEERLDAESYAAGVRSKLLVALWKRIPTFVLFREEDSSLPNLVDIDEDNESWVEGSESSGADNFLASAGLTLAGLLTDDHRDRSSLISKGIRDVDKTLTDYWTQVLGNRGRIKIEVEFARHGSAHPKRAGKAYLKFWISEGDGEKLHPSQRSKGTRWYVAFFLQLIAAQRDGDDIVLLLDEPGAYLHATAQGDVLRLITKLADKIPVIYSTHSPYLIDHKRIDRVLAVERDASDEHSNTIVRRGLELAASSHLTLAPVLALMGTDLSTQQLVKRSGNVLLEENSAYFYFSAFVMLTGVGSQLSFVACNGADNIRVVADLLTAWRLEFKVAVDGDEKGVKVARALKAKWMLSDDDYASRVLILKDINGIEDAFEREDFLRHIAVGKDLPEGQLNSKAVATLRLSKPLLAVQFFNAVSGGEIKKEDLTPATLDRFSVWLGWMAS